MHYSKTICSKHTEILAGISNMQDLVNTIGVENLYDIAESLATCLENLTELTNLAMQDGQSMETGLVSKKEHIKDLEKQVAELDKYYYESSCEVERLQEEINKLEAGE